MENQVKRTVCERLVDAWARQQGMRLTIEDIERLFYSPDNAGGTIDRHIRYAADTAKEARESRDDE